MAIIGPIVGGIIQLLITKYQDPSGYGYVPVLWPLTSLAILFVSNHMRSENIYYDLLTNVLNKIDFEKKAIRLLKSKANCYLLIMDIDGFKNINDTYGHQQGDIVLKDVAINLKKAFQTGKGVVSRFGGDEYSILLYDTTIEEVYRRYEHFRSLIASSFSDIIKERYACSFGVAEAKTPGEIDYATLFIQADHVLYDVKANGGNGCSFYDRNALINTIERKLMLIVDDVKSNRKIVSNIFMNSYNVIECGDGLEAFEIIKEYHSTISVILLDIIMPRMNGFALLKILNTNPEYAHIKVVIISGEDYNPQELSKYKIDAYIQKPFNLSEISNTVEKICKDK